MNKPKTKYGPILRYGPVFTQDEIELIIDALPKDSNKATAKIAKSLNMIRNSLKEESEAAKAPALIVLRSRNKYE